MLQPTLLEEALKEEREGVQEKLKKLQQEHENEMSSLKSVFEEERASLRKAFDEEKELKSDLDNSESKILFVRPILVVQ